MKFKNTSLLRRGSLGFFKGAGEQRIYWRTGEEIGELAETSGKVTPRAPCFFSIFLIFSLSIEADSYPVAFRRRKRGDAEDFGKEMRGAQRVMGRTNSEKVASFTPSSPQSFARRLKATGYESAIEVSAEERAKIFL